MATRIATATLKSISNYSQSQALTSPRGEREKPDEHEKRVWRERLHTTGDGQVFIPSTAFKNCLSEAVKFTPRKGPTGKSSTWTKNFEAGVLVVEPLLLPIKKDDVPYERLFVPSNGQRGGGKRVWKYFPLIKEWGGTVQFYVFDDSITPEIFETYLREAGMFIGIGRFRPRNNGYYGRFAVTKIGWSNVEAS